MIYSKVTFMVRGVPDVCATVGFSIILRNSNNRNKTISIVSLLLVHSAFGFRNLIGHGLFLEDTRKKTATTQVLLFS